MRLPLFPLHTVLFPGLVVPLHVFEERYRALTRQCLESSSPFGIVLIQAGREVGPTTTLSLAPIGAMAEIREAGRYADGRYDLLVAGTGRFALGSVEVAEAPYLVGEVTPIDDTLGDQETAERLARAAVRRFVRYLELLRARDGETVDPFDVRVEVDTPSEDQATEAESGSHLRIPDDPTILSYLLSGILSIELPRRQALLETATTVGRLAELMSLLDREVLLLQHRLRFFAPDPGLAAVRRS